MMDGERRAHGEVEKSKSSAARRTAARVEAAARRAWISSVSGAAAAQGPGEEGVVGEPLLSVAVEVGGRRAHGEVEKSKSAVTRRTAARVEAAARRRRASSVSGAAAARGPGKEGVVVKYMTKQANSRGGGEMCSASCAPSFAAADRRGGTHAARARRRRRGVRVVQRRRRAHETPNKKSPPYGLLRVKSSLNARPAPHETDLRRFDCK